ncbi:MAG TPA: hypothetical protein V6D48_24110 [Oculatellaceae cyanobacterium]
MGTTKVAVIVSDVYNNNGSSIGNTVGVEPVSDANKPDTSSTSSDLLRSGQALKIRVRYNDGAKPRTADVLCDIDKAKTAVAELVGKTFRNGTIRSAYFPRRARYS